MDKLTKIDENKLAAALIEWFNTTNTSKDHFWIRNKVAEVIKDNLILLGHWKNRKRGNPQKGWNSRRLIEI